MEGAFTIGKLAKAAGVKRSTIRYYQGVGLLEPASRSPRGYRYYDGACLERLRFIRAAQSTGFSLDDIHTLLRLRERNISPCQRVQSLIDSRLKDVEQQLASLRHVQRVLQNARQQCLQGEREDRCAVLETLEASAASPEKR